MADIHIHAPLCIAASAVFPPLCATLVAVRFYARKRSGAGYGWDDWLTVPALFMIIGMCAAVLKGVADKAVGYPTPPEPPGEDLFTVTSYKQRETKLIYWSNELMQLPALTAIKLSFMFFYRRTLRGTGGKLLDISIWILTILIATWGLAYFLAFLFICPGHPDAYWLSLHVEKEHCIDTVMLHNSYGISDVILDLLLILFPIPLTWQLHLSLRKKLGLIGVFGLGSFAIVASIFRMVAYLQSTAAEFRPGTDTDILITGGLYWSVVECGVALISACLPTTQGVLRSTIVAKRTSATISLQSDVMKSNGGKSRNSRYQNRSEGSDGELAQMGVQSTINASEGTPPLHVSAGKVLVTRTLSTESRERPEEVV